MMSGVMKGCQSTKAICQRSRMFPLLCPFMLSHRLGAACRVWPWILEGPQPLAIYTLYSQMIEGCILMALTSSKQIISSGPVSAPSGERVNYASDIISLEGKRAVLSDSSISHWLRAFKLLGNSRFL